MSIEFSTKAPICARHLKMPLSPFFIPSLRTSRRCPLDGIQPIFKPLEEYQAPCEWIKLHNLVYILRRTSVSIFISLTNFFLASNFLSLRLTTSYIMESVDTIKIMLYVTIPCDIGPDVTVISNLAFWVKSTVRVQNLINFGWIKPLFQWCVLDKTIYSTTSWWTCMSE